MISNNDNGKTLIYLDNAATTRAYPEVVDVLTHYSTQVYYNPSALYPQSVAISAHIRTVRENIKSALRAPEGELYFLSGGTEADNTALFCTPKTKNSRIIVGEGEHDAVIKAANELKTSGYDVVFAPIDKNGAVNVEKFAELLTPNTALVSIMHVSNETGAINDIARLARLTKKTAPSAIFHSDGVQAFGKIKVNLQSLGVDLYSISAHKIHGAKGVGGLFVKKGVSVRPLIFGGGQEKGFRSGTENVPAIMAFARAVELNQENFTQNYSKKVEYKEYLTDCIAKNIPDTVIISEKENSVPNILTVAFENVRGEVLLHSLEKYGILVGIGSACSSHHESRFKTLLGLDEKHRDGIIRFSTGDFNDISEVDTVVNAIKAELETLNKYTRI